MTLQSTECNRRPEAGKNARQQLEKEGKSSESGRLSLSHQLARSPAAALRRLVAALAHVSAHWQTPLGRKGWDEQYTSPRLIIIFRHSNEWKFVVVGLNTN